METSFLDMSTSSLGLGDDSNLNSSIRYVEQELQTLGIKSPFDELSGELNKSRTITVLHKLLQLHRQSLRIIDEVRDSLARGKSDVLIQREALARLKDDVKGGEKELAIVEDRERQLNQKVKTLSSKLRAEQDEVRRLKVSMQYKETQRNHENKKREKEFERLKQKLEQLVSHKSHERQLGVSMLNALHKTGEKRKMWNKPGSGDEDMYRAIVTNYEERQKELMLENSSLRESLAGMERQLISLLNQQQATVSKSSEGDKNMDSASNIVSSGHFQMPYDIVREDIEQSFQDKCKLVKEHIDDLKLRLEKLEAAPAADGNFESEINTLEHKLSDYRNIIGRQEEMLLQKSLGANESEESHDSDVLNESSLWHDRNKLDMERHQFSEQKRNFEEERQMYMEAVHSLDRERQIFEDGKAAFLRENIAGESSMNSTQELDSFFMKLCSTPAQSSENKLSRYIVHQNESNTSGSSSSMLHNSVMVHHDVDLKHDLSMCSDDGMSILNENCSLESLSINKINDKDEEELSQKMSSA